MIRNLRKFIKKETVLTISGMLALCSMLVVPPDVRYASYIDFKVLAMLFCLMIVVAGFQGIGLFACLGKMLVQRTADSRELSMVLVFSTIKV